MRPSSRAGQGVIVKLRQISLSNHSQLFEVTDNIWFNSGCPRHKIVRMFRGEADIPGLLM